MNRHKILTDSVGPSVNLGALFNLHGRHERHACQTHSVFWRHTRKFIRSHHCQSDLDLTGAFPESVETLTSALSQRPLKWEVLAYCMMITASLNLRLSYYVPWHWWSQDLNAQRVKKNADNTKHVLIFGDKNPYSFVEEWICLDLLQNIFLQ